MFPGSLSIVHARRSTSSMQWLQTIYSCNTTSITCRSWRETWHRPSSAISIASAICSWRTIPGAMSRAAAKSTTRSCSDSSMRWVIPAGSVANTNRPVVPWMAWRGSSLTFGSGTSMSKVGFVGLGIMGRPMAGHLCAAGHELYVHDHKPAPQALLAQVAIQCPSGQVVAQRADFIITMVPDTPNVAAALFDADGIAAGLSPGKIVIDMSSISPVETKGFAVRIEALGCQYLDAPVSGGEVGARAASLTIMVGGPESAFGKVKPLLELMGKNITRVGGNGDGQTCKVANQIIVALSIEA